MWKKESLVVQRAVKGPRTRGLILKLTKDILELMMEAKKNIGLITFLMAALKLIKDAMNKSFKIWVSKAVKRGAKRP